jgi:chromosome segregation protein
VHFTKLKLTGFKSFVEPTEFAIDSGLTGVVGPNGCGKSNLVEALRWVMGETSAKQMRGGEMDDVIFSGTESRAPRNLAEVVLQLDNRDRRAPAAFNDSETIEVVRRIERGAGSLYRVNGIDVRARDVQLLFADVASGAHSSAMVGQGRVNDVINAKPAQRRLVLEEAAGITGLHARRHEAELKLRAAEANLARVHDVLGALDAQLHGLKRQARQAGRYRRLSESLRRLEALSLYLRWQAAAHAAGKTAAALDDANRTVGTLTAGVAAATTADAKAALALPALRQAEAELGAALHRLALARDGLEAEEHRLAEERRGLETRARQIETDLERERTLSADGEAALARVAAEREGLIEARDAHAATEAESEAAALAAAEAVRGLDARHTRLLEELAASGARRGAIERALADLAERARRLDQERVRIEAEHAALLARAAEEAARQEAAAALEAAQQAVEAAKAEAEACERRRREAQAEANPRRDELQSIEARLARYRAERDALEAVLGRREPGAGPSVVDVIAVEPGFEAALGAALGDDLDAPENPRAAIHWATLAPLANPPALPAGAEPLSAVVQAPRALARRLSQVGVVDEALGPALREALAPGQRLVARSGAMWRWDGFTLAPDAPTTAAIRLKQRNRLSVLAGMIAESEGLQLAARGRGEAAEEARRAADEAARTARAEADRRRDAHQAALDRKARLDAAAAADATRLEALGEALSRLAGELDEAATAHARFESALAALPPPDAGRAEATRLRAELDAARALLDERVRRHDQMVRERTQREARLRGLAEEANQWEARRGATRRRIAELEAREVEVRAGLAAIADRPDEIATRRRALLSEIETVEAKRRAAADALAAGEQVALDRARTLKAAGEALAAAREERARLETRLDHARSDEAAAEAQIRERLECAPEEALARAEPEPDEALPAIETVEERVARLARERDAIGPVNLRAEIEARELEEEIETLNREKGDLEAAIARLRQGIASLNREGRERVLAAFGAIDGHFQALFTKLFGGGHAHLVLVDSEDPLEAGLEIMASPPGKRLQALSLLSGGEKALTALALLFAAFLTNPAPICVLDEADAPLDESNVGRFCALIEELAGTTETRFLVITHNRVTMARVHRLYGVTMAERGVSQLVSVDLQAAEQLRETA